MKLPLYVLCSNSPDRGGRVPRGGCVPWIEKLPELAITPISPGIPELQSLHELAHSQDVPFLVCRDYVWLGRGVAAQTERLIQELNEALPNWAVCGNRGVRWDGRHLYDFTRSVDALGLQTSLGPHPVLSVDDNLLLVNPQRLRTHARRAPATTSAMAPSLSLECLQNGSVMAASPRLMAVRSANEDGEGKTSLEADTEFLAYCRSSFLNHYFPTPDGELNFSELVDYNYVAEPWTKAPQEDILDLYDKALQAARTRRRPSLTICCRTQFGRPELLERCVLSLSSCPEYACGLADIHVRLITDQPAATADPIVSRLRAAYRAAHLDCWFHQIRPGRFSRTDLLISAIERAETDYIWFIDDDDFAIPPAVTALSRCLIADRPMVIAASSMAMRETWSPPSSAGGRAPAIPYSERSHRYSAADVFRVLTGDNYIPICSMVLPVPLMRERLRGRKALGDYNEDYFLLLLALTAPRVEVCVLPTDIASISVRDKENTGLQKDRSQWHFSYATFLLELLNNEEGNSPFLWQQANAPPL